MGEREILEALGGPTTFGRKGHGRVRLAERVARGLPIAALDHVKKALDLNDAEIAVTLGVSQKTVSRRRRTPGRMLSPAASDRLYRIARLLAFATEVLEGREQAQAWLRRPQPGLGNRVPFELMNTEAGAREVEDLIGRIEHGVFS